jgi:hypothetical protein
MGLSPEREQNMADHLSGTLRPGESSSGGQWRFEPQSEPLDGWFWHHRNQWAQADRDANDAMIDEHNRETAEAILAKDPENAQALHMLERISMYEKERESRT